MKRDGFSMRVWKMLYPMLIIFGFLELVSAVYLFVVALSVGVQGYQFSYSNMTDAVTYNNMFLVAIGQSAAAVCLFYFYQKDKKVIHVTPNHPNLPAILVLIVMAASACLGINFTMDILHLNDIFSETAQEVGTLLYSEPLWVQIVAMAVVAPIAEELAFRGLIFKRVRTYTKFIPASFLTAVLFGLYHGNVLQIIYAFAISWILTLVYEQFLSIKYCMLVHACMNLVSVLASSTNLLNWIPVTGWQFVAVTFAADMITILCVLLLLGPLAPRQGDKK